MARKLNKDGSTTCLNVVSDLNDFYTGITVIDGTVAHCPDATTFWLIISGGINGAIVQLGFSFWNTHHIKQRYQDNSGNWRDWFDVNS